MYRVSLLALLLFSASLFAEPPKLDVPKEVKGDVCEIISIPAVTNAVNVAWIAVDDKVKFFPREKLKNPLEGVVSVKTPGRYVIYAVASNDNGEQTVTTTVLVIGAVVPPPKTVDPKPVDPLPTTASAKLVVVVIEETAEAAVARSKFFDDKSLTDLIQKKKHVVMAIDKDIKDKDGNVPTKLVGYLNEAKGKGTPYVVMVDAATAKIVYSGALPKSPDEALQLLIKYGGN